MGISQKDIKLLWGRSGNRCAICKIELTQDKSSTTSSFTLGEQAHIVGENEGSARSDSPLTEDERNGYHNLILLCPNHHTEIDKNENDWRIEKLHLVKSQHELWVTETLAETADAFQIAKQVVVTNIIDAAVKLCRLEEWENWTSFALAPDPEWPKELPEDIFKFRQKIIGAIWPEEFDELKRAAITFSVLLHRSAETFQEHCQERNGKLRVLKFYKAFGYNENYDEDLKRYIEWIGECHHLVKDATKAVNWFAEMVRKYVNPMFFADRGKFIVTDGPYEDMSFRTALLEFSEEEKSELPEKLLNPKSV